MTRLLGVLGGGIVQVEEDKPGLYGVKCPLVETYLGQAALDRMPDTQRLTGNVTWGDVKRLVRQSRSPDESGVFFVSTSHRRGIETP